MKKIMAIVCMVLFLCSSALTGLSDVKDNAAHTYEMSSQQLAPLVDDAYDLLIVTPAEFSDALQPLVEHKESYGVKTIIVSLDEIYNGNYFTVQGRDDAEKVKYFIKNALDEWSIGYVLLVGGRKPGMQEEWLMPVRYSHIEDNVATKEDRYISDLYYADVYDADGNFSSWDTNNNGIFGEWRANKSADDIMDLYPDVYIGRLPCRNNFEVEIMVDKIINYEEGKCNDSWFKKMVVVGGDTYTFNDYYEGEVANQQALDRMPGFEPIKLWTSDGSLQGWADVVKTINQGCGFLYFAGHGSPTTWATHPPYDEKTWIYGLQIFQMPLLSNKDKLPVCIVGGCHNSLFNVSLFRSTWTFGLPVPECWSWWLTRCIKGGSIATLGCTGLGYGEEDKQGEVKKGGGDWIDILFFNEYGENNVRILGEAWGKAIVSYLNEFPIDWNERAFNDTALDAKTTQEWILFGDPSLKIGGYA
ncbi:MAG: C25 family cysteine peptidase [Candidatus Thermoplasmatota archaeon]|nr:C25 family cysteine peptidase [Candidatus Thermoplasmatota archaeon]